MAAFDYAKPLATANRLIARFGQRGAIRRLTPGNGPSYNPGQPTATNYPADFAIVSFMAKEVDGTRILQSDRKALLSPGSLTITPTTADQIIIGGVVYSIQNVDVLAPAGTAVLYTIQCRR